jgi:hypothetical protein
MLTLSTPERPSLAMAETVTLETCQPFAPSGGGTAKLTAGAVPSTLIEAEACKEVSPWEDRAQKLMLVVPSGKVHEQDAPLHNMPATSDSMPVML